MLQCCMRATAASLNAADHTRGSQAGCCRAVSTKGHCSPRWATKTEHHSTSAGCLTCSVLDSELYEARVPTEEHADGVHVTVALQRGMA